MAVIYQQFANQQDVLGTLQQGEPDTVKFESLEGNYPSYKLWDAQGQFLGYGVIADASGYGGKLTMLSIVDEAGIIKNVALIEEYETPLYLNKVVKSGVFEELTGRNIQDQFTDLDVISGATVTTEAIFGAVQKGTTQSPIWYIMVLGVLLITLVLGKNVYCNWLCPFGAAQEGIYKGLNLFSFSPSGELRRKVSQARWPMLWLVVVIALVFNNPGIASYEPFSVFFDGSGNRAQWIIMLLVLLMSMAQLRFWCHNFCPVGAILNFTARIKGKVNRLRKKEESRLTNQACKSCAEKRNPLIRQDKFYVFVVSVVNILIIVSLIESIL